MRPLARPGKARRRKHARNRQTPPRFRHPSPDDLLPAGSARRADDRADRNRKQANPGQLRRNDGTNLRRSANRSRARQERTTDPTRFARRRSPSRPPPNSQVGEESVAPDLFREASGMSLNTQRALRTKINPIKLNTKRQMPLRKR